MTQKISSYKVSKIIELHLAGYSQPKIAKKLNISQPVVSLYIGKFNSLVEEKGIKAATEEFGVTGQVEALHGLAVDLKEAKLTVEEVKAALKMEMLLKKLGVKEEEYPHLIQACTELDSKGLIPTAIKLTTLEGSTGMTYEEIISNGAATHTKLMEEQQDLQATTEKLDAEKEALEKISEQKNLAAQNLETYLEEMGADMKRIKLVEGLALALKKAGVTDTELDDYIARQQILNKAGIGIDTLAALLEKVHLVTSLDGGQALYKMLSEYGGLVETNSTLEAKIKLLHNEVDNLEELAALKSQIQGEVMKLKAEKAGLEADTAQLKKLKNQTDQTKSELTSLGEKKKQLEHEVARLELKKEQLIEDIESKEKKLADFTELEAKYNGLQTSLAEVKAQLEQEKTRLMVFESFLGLVKQAPLEGLEQFIQTLSHLLDEAKKGKYSLQLLRTRIVRELTGGALQVLKCTSCDLRFCVDKKPGLVGYYCPICGSTLYIIVDKDELTIIKAALEAAESQSQVVVTKLPKLSKQPEAGGEGGM